MERNTPTHVSRRSLFAAAGAVGAGLSTAMLPLASAGADTPPEPPTGMPQLSIAEIRSMSAPPSAAFVFVTDPGQEGVFRVDGADATSADNTGAVLVSTAGTRFHRVFDGHLNARWFGAAPEPGGVDDPTDSAPALQQAIDTAQNHNLGLFLPSGWYSIKATLKIDSTKGIQLYGAGMSHSGTVVRAHPSISTTSPIFAIFQFSSSARESWCTFQEMFINASNRAQYCVYAPQITNTYFSRVGFEYATAVNVGIGYGWSNTFADCAILSSGGDGFHTVGTAVNNLNIINSVIRSNVGVGVNLVRSGNAIRISGCDLESNKGPAIFVQPSYEAVNITDCYFENNSSDGYTFTTPARTIKSHILVNGYPSSAAIGSTSPVGSVRIMGNFVSVSNVADPPSLVAAFGVNGGLEVSDNAVFATGSAPRTGYLVDSGTSMTGLGARVENLHIARNNLRESSRGYFTLLPVRLPDDDLAGAVTQLHDAAIQGVYRANYSAPLMRFKPITRDTSGTWRKYSQTYRGHDVYQIADAKSETTWGFEIDLDSAPELAGKYVYFACFAKASTAGDGPVLYTSHLGPSTTEPAPDTDWHVVSYVDKLPATGVISFGVAKLSDDPTTSLLVSRPVLSEVGVRFDDHLGA